MASPEWCWGEGGWTVVPVVAAVGVTRWRGVYGTYRGCTFLLLLLLSGGIESCSEGAGDDGLGESSGCVSRPRLEGVCSRWRWPAVRPMDVFKDMLDDYLVTHR